MPTDQPSHPRRDLVILLMLAAVPALLSAWFHPARPTLTLTRPAVPEIALGQVARLTPPVLWIDARPALAYTQAHIPGAILCNEDQWEQCLPALLATWRPGTTLIVYCDAASCAASQSVALRLQRELSLPDPVYVLQGGWATWQKSRP